MVDRRKAFSLIPSWDHCQRSSPSWISDTLRAGFELAQNLSSDFVEWSCAAVITTTPRRRYTTTPWCIFIKTKRFDIRVKLRSKNYCQEVSETLFLFFHYLLFLSKVFDIENLKLIQNFTADENPICTLAVGNQMLFSGSLKSIKVGSS